jgi:CheY-like chemotaxis protein
MQMDAKIMKQTEEAKSKEHAAIPKGGILTFQTQSVSLNKDSLGHMPFSIAAGTYAQLDVIDTGTGMNSRIKAKAFEPFFSTKKIGKGTGLGLASAYGTVKQHNGYIIADSRPGKGATFSLYFPVGPALIEMQIPKKEDSAVRGQGKILVVDDEEFMADSTKDMLEELGYSVKSFKDPEKALEHYRLNWSVIDSVILDIIMPKMTGLECFRKMKEINPAVNALIASGYTGNKEEQKALKEGAKAFIEKPYTVSQLSQALATALGKGSQ